MLQNQFFFLIDNDNSKEEPVLLSPNGAQLSKTQSVTMMPHTIVRPLARKNLHRKSLKGNLNDDDEEVDNLNDLGIIKQFPFSSSLQRMSVIVKSLKVSHFDLFTKRSPEKIVEFSRPETGKL